MSQLKKYKADLDFYIGNKKDRLDDIKKRIAIQDQQLQEKAVVCSELGECIFA